MIDPRAIIAPGAKLAENVTIGPFAVIGPRVTLGEGCIVGPHAVIEGHTTLGRGNHVFQFASIGACPQDLKYHGEDTLLEIGDNNSFREFCTVHTGTVAGGSKTVIGSNNLIMNYVHIAHDCIIGSNCILANYTGLAGHVTIDDFAVLSGFAKVVQFAHIGAYSFIIANSDVGKDVLPYTLVGGTAIDIKPYGLNLVGLRRHNFSEATIGLLKQAYNIILRRHLTTEQALDELKTMLATCPEVQRLIDALTSMGQRGIIR